MIAKQFDCHKMAADGVHFHINKSGGGIFHFEVTELQCIHRCNAVD